MDQTNRTPRVIADDLKTLRAGAKLSFVPLDVVRAVDLMIEFSESVATTLEAAGLIVEPAPVVEPVAV